MDYLQLLEKFEKDIIGEHISEKRHSARLDFAHWLNQYKAEQKDKEDSEYERQLSRDNGELS